MSRATYAEHPNLLGTLVGFVYQAGFVHAVFGDGDPNADYEARRWAMVGQLIQARGGVVAAEELAPYLDVTPEALAASATGGFVDEGYVVPALVRFGGQPEVGPDGELLYRFPSLQRTARAQARTRSQLRGWHNLHKF